LEGLRAPSADTRTPSIAVELDTVMKKAASRLAASFK
jgi:hypothetical protein